MTPTKSIWKSKTIWLNLIMGLLAIIALINPEILTVFGLSPEAQHNALTIIATVTAVLNLILRMISGTAVTMDSSKINQ